MAPSAQKFFDAEQKLISFEHNDYMDFAERYADFIIEFEKYGGNLAMVHLWPANDISRRIK